MLTNVMRIFHKFLRDLFIIGGIGFLMLLIMEDIRPGFVSFWFDIKIVLLIVVISGFLTLLTSKFTNSQNIKEVIK